MKIHHIGYLVKNMASSITVFVNLGYSVKQAPIYDADRDIDICFMENGAFMVELVAPRPECKLFRSLQKKIGNAPYHICYITDDFVADMKVLQDNEYTVLIPPSKAVAIDNRLVVFMFHEEVGIIELVES